MRQKVRTMEPNSIERTEEQLLPPPQSYPWLLYFNGKGIKNQTFCSILDPTKTYSKSIPELGASSLWTIQYGWCLFANKIQNAIKLFLWNSSNLMRIELPPLNHNDIDICHIIFSCSPTTTDSLCSIFIFSYSSTIYYCQVGDNQWTEVDYRESLVSAAAVQGRNLCEDEIHLKNPVYCNCCLYAESQFGSFLVVIEKLHPHGLKINSIGVSLPRLPLTSFDSTRNLLRYNNELFQIEILHAQDKVITVAVHRLNFSAMVWEKVENIRDKVFFVSNNLDNFDLPFACQAINPESEGGRIYFTFKDKNFIYIYNIEDNTFMISEPFSNLPKNSSSVRWFMPDLRMTGSLKEERGQTQINSVDGYSKEMVDDGARNASALILYMVDKMSENLNVIDYLNFRATRRAPPIQWRSFSSLSSWSPLFVCFGKDRVLTMTHPKQGLKYKYNINLSEDFQANYEICYSKDGWLLMVGNTISNIFFNPFTREVKQLVDGPLTDRNTRCVGFSHPPTSSECVAVEISKVEEVSKMLAFVTRLGKGEWDHYEFVDNDFPLYNMSPTYHKGGFYYISEKGKLGVLEVEEDGISWEEFGELNAPCTDYYNCFLVECNGSLLSVFEGSFGKWVRVFKLSESEMTWTQVESLGNYMLFVGNTSLSTLANIPGMENKIYFPRFFDQDIVFYSLETNKYHTFKNEVVNYHDVKERLNSSWIEARWN